MDLGGLVQLGFVAHLDVLFDVVHQNRLGMK